MPPQVLKRALPKMIHLETRLDQDLAVVKGDPAQLEQVFLNLGTNARDAMPEGGRLVIETMNLRADETPAPEFDPPEGGDYILIRVRDTGQGMDEQTQKHIFDPLFHHQGGWARARGWGSPRSTGSSRPMGGRIECRSKPGLGTTFSIYLPASEARPETAAEKSLSPDELPGGRERILVVEDEEPILEIARIALGNAGYGVITATNGEEALDLYEKEGPAIDLVILDMSMPGMGGLTALGHLLEMNPGIAVLVASGYTSEDRVNKTLEAGARGFIGKPYRLGDLLTKVRSILDQREED